MAAQEDVEEIEDDDFNGLDGNDEPLSEPKSKAVVTKSKLQLANVASETIEVHSLVSATLNKVAESFIHPPSHRAQRKLCVVKMQGGAFWSFLTKEQKENIILKEQGDL